VKYYVSEEVQFTKKKTERHTIAIDIGIILACFSCDEEYVVDELISKEEGYFCHECCNHAL
jgi:hypothetical protein